MKRSLINSNIEWAMELCKEMHFNLPDFAYWTPEEWEKRKGETQTMRRVISTRQALFCLRSETAA